MLKLVELRMHLFLIQTVKLSTLRFGGCLWNKIWKIYVLDPEFSINTIFRNIRMLTSEALQKFSQQLKKVYIGKHIR